MRAFANFALCFSGSVLVTCLIWSGVAVYAFDGYEHAWGKGPTFQVLTWISLAVSLVALASSAVGGKLGGMQRRAPLWLPLSFGVFFVVLNYALGWGIEALGYAPNRVLAIVWVVVVPAVIAFVVARRLAAPFVTSNTSFERTREG
jgi:hypothetical protein